MDQKGLPAMHGLHNDDQSHPCFQKPAWREQLPGRLRTAHSMGFLGMSILVHFIVARERILIKSGFPVGPDVMATFSCD